MSDPITNNKPLEGLSLGDFDVIKGTSVADKDQLDRYLVLNRTTGVVEFQNEVLTFVKDWLQYFVNGEVPNSLQQDMNGNVLSMAAAKKSN